MNLPVDDISSKDISVLEYQRSKDLFVYLHQSKLFGRVLSQLTSNKTISITDPLLKIKPLFA